MPKLYWDSIEKGEQVTPVVKPAVTRVQIAKFAGASQDFSPLHLDDEFAKAAGYGGVFAHGAIGLSFATEALAKWLENGRVLGVSGRFRKLVWPGDSLRMTGMVAEKYELNGEARIDVDVWAENQNHDSVMQGTITCIMWRNDKDEKKSKAPWPPVSPQTIKERRTGKSIPKSDAEAAKAREAAQAVERGRGQAANPPRAKPGVRTAPAPVAPRPEPVKPPAPVAAKPAAPPKPAAKPPAKPTPKKAAPAKKSKPKK